MTVKHNRDWKRAFFILVGFTLITSATVACSILYLVFSPPPIEPEKVDSGPGLESFFTLSTTKSAMNKWINEELSKREKKFDNIHYEVILNEYINLQGNLIIFNREVPFQMVFEPFVNEEQGLTLREREIRLGKLQLPGDVVLALIGEQINFPKWVKVVPSRHEIIVNVKEIELEKGMQLSITEFDLENDQLQFNLKR
jgi:uncharacterized protein YpmS